MKLTKITKYINETTGEFYEKREKVDPQFDDIKGYLFFNKRDSIKIFNGIPLPDEFTAVEKGRIEELRQFIMKESQLLVYRSNNVIKPITQKEFNRIFGLNDRQSRDLVKKMKTFGVIKEVSVDNVVYFVFNPLFGFKGKRITLLMFLWFQYELSEVLPSWVKEKFLAQAEALKPNIEIFK